MCAASFKSFRIRSFVRRGRKTEAQQHARDELWSAAGLEVEAGQIDYAPTFGRLSDCFLEIGFGTGRSLLALAKARPHHDFIAVETHKAGIGALLLGMMQEQVSNIRIYDADVIDVLLKNIPDASLAGAQIFFPDPWPKRRHHARRLIQPDFIALLLAKLKQAATLHLATDWEDYAKHMMRVLSQEPLLLNLAGFYQFSERSDRRPTLTKFERRAQREGRSVWELQFKKINHPCHPERSEGSPLEEGDSSR